MSNTRFFRGIAMLLGGLLLSAHASAATYCVATADATDFQAKLNLAAASAENDVIRLRIGGFSWPGNSEGFVYSSSNGGSLTISGSWQGSQANPSGCVSQYGPNLTWIQGGSNHRAMTISMTSMTPGTVTLEKLELSGGTSALGGFGGCASIVTQGEVVLQRNEFSGCLAPLGDGGGLFLQANSAHIVSNQWFDNTARRGGAMYIEARGGAFYVNNNTVTSNLAEGLSGASGGLQFVSSGVNGADSVVFASNNILWGNAAGTDRYDIDISGLAPSAATLRYNHVDRIKGTPSGLSGNATNGNPRFVDPANGDYSLQADSPALNDGNSSALGGVGIYDINGAPRVQGAHIERGAYEFDQLFGNSFE